MGGHGLGKLNNKFSNYQWIFCSKEHKILYYKVLHLNANDKRKNQVNYPVFSFYVVF